MKLYIKIVIIIMICAIFLIMANVIYAQDYYTLPGDTIHSVTRDYYNGQLIVTSEDNVLIVNAANGLVIQAYQLPNRTWIAEVGNPDCEMIYGVYAESDWTSGLYCINRTSGQIITTTLQEHYYEEAVLQDETRIFVVSSNSASAIPSEDRGRVFVFSKTNLTPLEDWPCKPRPCVGIINNADGKIYVPSVESHHGHVIDEGMTYPSGEFWYYLGCYDSNRGGEIIYEDYIIPGFVTGMAVMNDGVVVAGMSGAIDWQKPNLAIINDPIEEIYIPEIDLSPLDCDIETNRVFAAVRDENTGKRYSNGLILNWDYDTGEYEIIDSGIPRLREVTYCDGKLYGITTEDNKLYVIDID